MSDFKLEYPPGATPLNPNEIAGLKLSYISTQRELNAAEQDNILRGEKWAFAKKRKDFLSERFMRDLHKQMFGHVWRWAGTYRNSDKSIGTAWYQIPAEMNKLINDVRYWITYETYPLDEIAARFHHRLVWIHPFPNGNGRWARTMADTLLFNLDKERFSWGAKANTGTLGEHSETRSRYIRSLQLADTKKYGELLEFVRS
ncbi:MAG: cell division protein Fic [Bdellovibrio sp. ArHS]|uniref:mobile mystery protein B n=1 Tax=Bdellovibrio sp. ArHS TaxID=1569284 RepID=UPI0005826AD9|nr:mobile mystery protein B [Bdellovibrio sp. ArHS]KHD87663.1 MAG: cell division protein Fic [Bdellovibrio sp. ArHS]